MIAGRFRPKSLGLHRPTIHAITVTFFTFLRFFENPKTLLRFFALLHMFSRIMMTSPPPVTQCVF